MSKEQNFIVAFLDTLAGGKGVLTPSLKNVFSKILTQQITISEAGEVAFTPAFESLAKVFTFIATPVEQRPKLGLSSYSSKKIKDAQEVAAAGEGLTVKGEPVEPSEPDVPSAGKGKTFTLTESSDELVGTEKDDIFKAVVGDFSGKTTLDVSDQIDGGAGNDTLQVDMKNNGFTGFNADAGIKNIENVVLNNTGTATAIFNAKGVTGVSQYTLNAKKAGLALKDLSEVGSKVQVNDQAAGELTIGFTADVVIGTDDSLTLGLKNMGTAAGKGIDAKAVKVKVAGIENLAVNVAGANRIDLSGATEAKTITLNSADKGTLNVTNIAAALTTFDASALTGAVHLDLSKINTTSETANLIMLKTGQGDDLVTLDATKLATNIMLDGGKGNNTLKLTGSDKATLGLDKQSISGFQTLELSGKGAKEIRESITGVETLVLNDQTGDVTATFFGAPEFALNTVGVNTANINLNAFDFGAGTGVEAGTVGGVLTYKTIAKTSKDVANLEVSTGEIVADLATKLVVELGDFTKQTGKLTANIATDVTLNVAKNAEFSAGVDSPSAQNLTINAAGKLSTKKINVNSAETVDITAEQGGLVQVVAAAANTVNITANAALDLGYSNFEGAETVAITAKKGLVTGSNINLKAVETLKLTGSDASSAIMLGDLGPVADGKVLNVTAVGLKGGVTLGTISTQDNGSINLDLTGMQGTFKVGNVQGDNIDITAASAGNTEMGDIISTTGNEIIINITKPSDATDASGEFIVTGTIGFTKETTKLNSPKSKSMQMSAKGEEEPPAELTGGFAVTIADDAARFELGNSIVAKNVNIDASAFTGTNTNSSFGDITGETINVKGKPNEGNELVINQGKTITVTGGAEADTLTFNQAIGANDVVSIQFDGGEGKDDDLVFTKSVDLTNSASDLKLVNVAHVKASELKVNAATIDGQSFEIAGNLVVAEVNTNTGLENITAEKGSSVEIDAGVVSGKLVLGGISDIANLIIAVDVAKIVPAGSEVNLDTTNLGLTNLTFKQGANQTSEEVVKLDANSVFIVPGNLTIQSGQLDVSAVPVDNFSVGMGKDGKGGEGTILTLNKSGLKLSVEQLLKLSKQDDLLIDSDPSANGVQVEITATDSKEDIDELLDALKPGGSLSGIFSPESKPTITVGDGVTDVTPGDIKDAIGDKGFVGKGEDPQFKYAEAVEKAKAAAETALGDLDHFVLTFPELFPVTTLEEVEAASVIANGLEGAIANAIAAAIAYVDATGKTHDEADDIVAAGKAVEISDAAEAATGILDTEQNKAFEKAFDAADLLIEGLNNANSTDPDLPMDVATAKTLIAAKLEGADATLAAKEAKALAETIANSIVDDQKRATALGKTGGEDFKIPVMEELTSISTIKDTAANLAAAAAEAATDKNIFKWADKIVVEGTATVAQAIAIVQAAAKAFVGVEKIAVVDTVANIENTINDKDLDVLTRVESIKFSDSPEQIELTAKQFTAFGSRLDDNLAMITTPIISIADIATVVEDPNKVKDGGIKAIDLTAAHFTVEGLPNKLQVGAATIVNTDLITGSEATALVSNAGKIKAGTIQNIQLATEQFVTPGVVAALADKAAAITDKVEEEKQVATVVEHIGKIKDGGISAIKLTAVQFATEGVIKALGVNAATITGDINTATTDLIIANTDKIANGGIQGKITLAAEDILKDTGGLLELIGKEAEVTVTSIKPLTVAEAGKIIAKTSKVTFDQIADDAENLLGEVGKTILAKAKAVTVNDAVNVDQVKTILDTATQATADGVTIKTIMDTATKLISLTGEKYLAALKKATDVTATIENPSDFNQDLSKLELASTTIKNAKITADGDFKGDFGGFDLEVVDKITLKADVAKLAGLAVTGEGNLVITAAAAINDANLENIAVKGTVTVTDVKGNVEHSINLGKVEGAATVTGGNKDDTITASKGGSVIEGGKGNDVIKLGDGSDTVKFGANHLDNGLDVISDFKVGVAAVGAVAVQGDTLDFNAFLGAAAGVNKLVGVNGVGGNVALTGFSTSAADTPTDIAGKVVVLKGNNVVVLKGNNEGALKDKAAIQDSIVYKDDKGVDATGKFNLANGEKAVVLSANGAEFNGVTKMNVYYVTGQQGADDIELVGTVTVDSAGFVTGNFA